MPLLTQTLFTVICGVALIGVGRGLRKITTVNDAIGGAGLDFAIGFAAVSLLATAIAGIGFLTWPVARVMALAIGISGVVSFLFFRREFFSKSAKTDRWAYTLLAACFVPALFMAAAPPVMRDALVYHLPIARRILDTGGLGVQVGDIYGHFPAGAEIGQALAMSIAGVRGAATIHLLSGIAAAWILYDLTRRRTGPGPALIVSATLAASPVAVVFAGAAYVDLTLCMAFAALMTMIDAFVVDGRRAHFIIAGFFGGLALSVKYTSLFYLGLFAIPILLGARGKNVGSTVKAALLSIGAMLIAGAPFLIRNAIATGNPVFPFAYELFGGAGWDAERAMSFDRFLHGYGAGYTPVNLTLMPFRLALTGRFGSTWFDGVIGPMALIVCVGAILAAFSKKRQVAAGLGAVALVACVSFLFGSHQARFALWVLTLLAPIAAAGLHRIWIVGPRVRNILVLASLAAFAVNAFQTAREFVRLDPFAAAVSADAADSYQAKRIPGWSIYKALNTHATARDRVLCSMTGNFRELLRVPYDSDPIFEDYTIRGVLTSATTPDDVQRIFTARGWTYFFFDVRALEKALDAAGRALLADFLNRYAKPVARDGNFLLFYIELVHP